MKVCPRCALYNPDTAEVCDCGFDFLHASSESVAAELTRSYLAERRKAVVGVALGAAAVALSVITYVASSGEQLTVFVGIAVFGFVMAGRSITRMRDLRQARKDGAAAWRA